MDLTLFNTLTRKKEIFEPLKEGHVSMYNCGPTVYDYAHIGNLRSYVFADILRRTFEYNGYTVQQVMNVTDVGHLTSDEDSGEDKMTKALKRHNKELSREAMKEIGELYTEKFREDLQALNIKMPESMPVASEHIEAQIKLIRILEEKGFIYTTSDGVYFDTKADKEYGKLRGAKKAGAKESRVVPNPEKENPDDFALWKFGDIGWDSPWGKGFPGWHIECSAMSLEYLGERFDIHTGGVDHIPVHHTNEIAQSENVLGHQHVNYWLHNEFVDVGGTKMAKSEENFITLRTLTEKEYNPLAYRYLLLGAHYRTKMDFSWKALDGAGIALKKLYTFVSELPETEGRVSEDYQEKFMEALNDDFNTPKALACVWDLAKDSNISKEDKKATLFDFDTVLGLGLTAHRKIDIPDAVHELVEKREEARQKEDWDEADTLRKEIEILGYTVKDTDTGPRIVKKG